MSVKESVFEYEFTNYLSLFPCRAENDKLKEQMVVKDEQVSASKAALERFTNAVSYLV